MSLRKNNTFVLSVGGSLIVPGGEINIKFLKSFRAFIIGQVKQGRKFFLVIGGGQTARTYMRAAAAVTAVTDLDRDLVGISSTRLNAQLVRAVLSKYAASEIVTDHKARLNSNRPIVLAAGHLPGHSTDYDAVLMAQANNVKTVINLSNIDYVYDQDPDKHPEAKAIKQINWPAFRQIVGNTWKPGLNLPFDPVASRQAQKLGLEVAILNGSKLKNLANYLEGKSFRGTVIS